MSSTFDKKVEPRRISRRAVEIGTGRNFDRLQLWLPFVFLLKNLLAVGVGGSKGSMGSN